MADYINLGLLIVAVVAVVISIIQLKNHNNKENNKLLSQLNNRYLGSGGRIAHCARDPYLECFTKIKSEHRFAVLAFLCIYHSLKASFRDGICIKKSRTNVLLTFDFGSGGRIRTDDLRVMSPTSYHCSTPHSLIPLRKSSAKLRTFFESTKLIFLFSCYSLIIRRLYSVSDVIICTVYEPDGSLSSMISAFPPMAFLWITTRP